MQLNLNDPSKMVHRSTVTVGGKDNPNLTLEEVINVSTAKWHEHIIKNKETIGEMLYENSPKLKASLDILFNKKIELL